MNVMTYLPRLIKSACRETAIAKHIACRRTKITAVIKNVIGESSKEELTDILKSKKNSLNVDESTDKGCTKHLCVITLLLLSDSN